MKEFLLYIKQNLSVLIPIFLAFLAGIIALYQVKLNVISNARIKWVESLRETISEYCMEISACGCLKLDMFDEKSKNPPKTDSELKEFIEEFHKPYTESARKVEKLNSKIILYLNSENKNHTKLESLLMENIDIIMNNEEGFRKKLDENLTDVLKISKKIFNSEWKKSRKLFTR